MKSKYVIIALLAVIVLLAGAGGTWIYRLQLSARADHYALDRHDPVILGAEPPRASYAERGTEKHASPQAAPAADAMDAAKIKYSAFDDQIVSLNGQIVKRLGRDYYQFSDQTGSVTVEIDDFTWPNASVTLNRPVHIVGKVDKDDHEVKIDVKRLDLL